MFRYLAYLKSSATSKDAGITSWKVLCKCILEHSLTHTVNKHIEYILVVHTCYINNYGREQKS